jgi:HK97 gp10 family phage protein
MAEGRVTQAGMTEARRALERLPSSVSLALRGAAHLIAVRIRDGAKQRLLAQTHGTGRTANAIAVVEDAEQQQFRVESKAVRPAPANLPIWLEYGTSKMAARPYMRPAAEAQRDDYQRAAERAVTRAAESVGL